jgi:hypothetical protein
VAGGNGLGLAGRRVGDSDGVPELLGDDDLLAVGCDVEPRREERDGFAVQGLRGQVDRRTLGELAAVPPIRRTARVEKH